jgi:hypothetical protein
MLRFATRFPRPNRVILVVCALTFGVAAVNHAVLASRHQGDVIRHWAFIGINAVAAALVARAPRWAIWPMGVLALRQTWSHGNDLVREGDLPSLGVLVFFPIVITSLVVERRRRTADRREPPLEERRD